MLQIHCLEYLFEVQKFAATVNGTDELEKKLKYLDTFGGTREHAVCHLHKDFSPNSFTFCLVRNGEPWLHGGLIYSGPGGPCSDGSGPSYSVSLDQDARNGTRPMWSVHT